MHGLGCCVFSGTQQTAAVAAQHVVALLCAHLRGGSDGTRFRQQSNVTGAAHALGQCLRSPVAPARPRTMELGGDAVGDGWWGWLQWATQAVGALSDALAHSTRVLRIDESQAEASGVDSNAGSLDFASLEHRRTVAECCWALGLIGHRALQHHQQEEVQRTQVRDLVQAVLGALFGVLSPAAEIGGSLRSYLWHNTVRNQAAFALVRLASMPGLTTPSLPHFQGHAVANRILHGMVVEAVRHCSGPQSLAAPGDRPLLLLLVLRCHHHLVRRSLTQTPRGACVLLIGAARAAGGAAEW
jgi:hypothetical protein